LFIGFSFYKGLGYGSGRHPGGWFRVEQTCFCSGKTTAFKMTIKEREGKKGSAIKTCVVENVFKKKHQPPLRQPCPRRCRGRIAMPRITCTGFFLDYR
jgi:hypothetical protein